VDWQTDHMSVAATRHRSHYEKFI